MCPLCGSEKVFLVLDDSQQETLRKFGLVASPPDMAVRCQDCKNLFSRSDLVVFHKNPEGILDSLKLFLKWTRYKLYHGSSGAF